MLKEFKEFIARGNVVDLAVAVVIGAAFGKIVTRLVDGIIMPPIGLLLGRVDFTNLYVPLSDAIKRGPDGTLPALTEATKMGPVIAYGALINDIISFLIIAFAVFLMVKLANSLKHVEAEVAAEPTQQELLLTEIRDIIKSK